jgi:hypothetical protein
VKIIPRRQASATMTEAASSTAAMKPGAAQLPFA